MKPDIEFQKHVDGYDWNYLNLSVDLTGIRDQMTAIILGFAEPVEFK